MPRIWPFFAGIFIALTLVLAMVFGMHFYLDYHTESSRLNSSETLNVELARSTLVEDIASVTTDLMFLDALFERISYSPQQQQVVFLYMAEVLITFAREKAVYDQIRFLDLSGKEVVRINLNNGIPQLVQNTQLQDKSGRYYVSQALKLENGQIYLSPFDLNVEAGQIEQPIKPVLRFATPVFDAQGKRQGLIILNYLGNRLLDKFRQVSANIGDHIQLLNQSGYWLSSPGKQKPWGFMYGSEVTYQTQYPESWERISQHLSGQFENEDGLFTFSTVSPVEEATNALSLVKSVTPSPASNEHIWKVVSHVEVDLAIPGLGSFVARYADLYLAILALLAVLAYLFAYTHVKRRRAEAQHTYEQRFRQTLEDIKLVALMMDIHGKLTFCNHFLLEMTGWTHEEVMGSDWVIRFLPEGEQQMTRGLLKQLELKSEYPHENESEICCKTGEPRLISWNNTLTQDENGRVIGITSIGEDITERRRAEDQVRQLSLAVEQSPASVMITDDSGLIEYVNPKFTQVTGYSLDEVLGRNPNILKSGETDSSEYEGLWQALMAGGEWRGEFHNQRKDGTLYWESAVISALRDLDGKITHFLAVKEDITEQKRLQQEVDLRNLELSRAQALTAMGRMASMLAHDLSNPLSSVKMAVQILGKQASSEDAKELASISQEQVSYMETIITEMLSYARPGDLQSSWQDAEKLLNGVIGTVQRRIVDFGVQVKLHCEAGLPTFPGDASKLRQLLANLLVNALQATANCAADERRVDIHAGLVMTETGRQLQFRVCDNGDGIDPVKYEKLFEPFFTTRAKGTGLGLAIVRQITELHGGTIELKPNKPKGTCAMLSLPLTPSVSTKKQAQSHID